MNVPSQPLCVCAPSVCRLWRECVRRVLRTHRSVTWISAGLADAGHLGEHCLVRVVAEEIEASKPYRAQFPAGLLGQALRTQSFSFESLFCV